jgi:GAF domain-containing protein
MGVLDVQSSKLDHFGPELVTVMETLARQIAGALSNARLFTSLDQSSRHDQALSVITQQIQGAVNVEEVLQVTARELGKALRMPQTVVELHMKPESR